MEPGGEAVSYFSRLQVEESLGRQIEWKAVSTRSSVQADTNTPLRTTAVTALPMDKSRTGAIGEVLHPMTATATALGRRGREIRGAETSVCVRMRRFARQQAAAKRRLIGTKEKGCLGEHHTRKGFQPAVLQSPAAPRAATRVACNRVKEGEKTPGSMMKKRRQISRGDEGQNRREAAENAEQLIDRRCEAKADSENPDEPVPTDRKQVPATPVKAAATMPSSGTKVASVSQEKQVKTSHGVVGPHRKQSGSGSFQKRESEEAGSERAARCSSRSHSAGRTERTRTEEEDMSREDERRRKAVERKSGAPNEERTGRSRRKTRSVATHAAGGACGSWSRYFDGEPEGVQSEPGHHQPGHQGDADAEKESGNRKNVQENSIAPLRRYNPRRACRDRRGMTPCGLEWTKHLIAMAKEQAFVRTVDYRNPLMFISHLCHLFLSVRFGLMQSFFLATGSSAGELGLLLVT